MKKKNWGRKRVLERVGREFSLWVEAYPGKSAQPELHRRYSQFKKKRWQFVGRGLSGKKKEGKHPRVFFS